MRCVACGVRVQLKLETDLKLKQQSLEEGEQQRLEAEQKLKELQQRVLGLSGGGAGGDAPDVILAKQQASCVLSPASLLSRAPG